MERIFSSQEKYKKKKGAENREKLLVNYFFMGC